jgi:hypothetical protein
MVHAAAPTSNLRVRQLTLSDGCICVLSGNAYDRVYAQAETRRLFGGRLKQEMSKARITKQKLSYLTGIAGGTIEKYMYCQRCPSLKNMYKICEVFPALKPDNITCWGELVAATYHDKNNFAYAGIQRGKDDRLARATAAREVFLSGENE